MKRFGLYFVVAVKTVFSVFVNYLQREAFSTEDN